MVEFREVHKKMFGSSPAAPSERAGSQQSQVDAELRKTAAIINAQEAQQVKAPMDHARGEQAKDDKAAPAAAEAAAVIGKDSDKDKAQDESKNGVAASPTEPQSSVEELPPELHSTVSAGPTGPGYVTDYATINQLSTAKKADRPIARAAHVAKGPAPKPPVATGAKDVPITDSRGPDSKPPKSFFGPKPLVTIGSYPDGSNPRPNRFARPANVEIVDADKGTTTLDSSGKSSGARTPSPGRTQSPDGPKMTVSINCKAPNRPSLSTRFSTNTNATQPVLANLANDVTEGAVVKTLTFKKDGPLNLILDGGLNSAHDGRIVVAEVREGGMIPVDGEISSGDQILMVDNTRLVNTTLTAARVAIQNAMASADNDLRLTIAKMP
ncbi:hypothetical protein V5799_020952 [Amblyomma americanum]|uniref:PDZ domain-containing protein n=1 Tax=Amblyomma americanum TaxID=6943 RepID=A0AAQ4ESL8_AMBAM